MKTSVLNRFIKRFRNNSYVTVSLAFHCLLIAALGGTVLFKVAQKTDAFTVSTNSSFLAEEPGPPEDLAPAEFEEITDAAEIKEASIEDSAPAEALMSALTTASTSSTSFAMPDNLSPTLSMGRSMKSMGSGEGNGLGSMGSKGRLGGGGGGRTSFFGIQATGQRFAFLLDMSQTMGQKPERLRLMRAEATAAIQKLPADCEVCVILWAGGAWLLGQTWLEVQDKWVANGLFDFQVKKDIKLDPPKWIRMSEGNRRKMIKDLETAQGASGTDWKSSFMYVMQAEGGAPDVIFFMTDGQLNNEENTMKEISQALGRGSHRPTVNTVIVGDDEYARDPLKKLAHRNKGEFREVK